MLCFVGMFAPVLKIWFGYLCTSTPAVVLIVGCFAALCVYCVVCEDVCSCMWLWVEWFSFVWLIGLVMWIVGGMGFVFV